MFGVLGSPWRQLEFWCEPPFFPSLQVQRSLDHLPHSGSGNPPPMELLHDGYHGRLAGRLAGDEPRWFIKNGFSWKSEGQFRLNLQPPGSDVWKQQCCSPHRPPLLPLQFVYLWWSSFGLAPRGGLKPRYPSESICLLSIHLEFHLIHPLGLLH